MSYGKNPRELLVTKEEYDIAIMNVDIALRALKRNLMASELELTTIMYMLTEIWKRYGKLCERANRRDESCFEDNQEQ